MCVIMAECYRPSDVRSALARAYSHSKNEKKVIDPDLVNIMVDELMVLECAAVKCELTRLPTTRLGQNNA